MLYDYDDQHPGLELTRYEATLYDMEYRANWLTFEPYSDIQQAQAQEESLYKRSLLP